jgi:hypothetical protein
MSVHAITISNEESLRLTREISRLDGFVEGVRLMAERRKSELVQEASARAIGTPAPPASDAPPPPDPTT